MRIFQVAVSTLISSVADGFGLQFFDFDFGDAVAFDRLNRVTMALVIETLTLSRDSLQACQDEAGQSLKSRITGQQKLVLRLQIANADGAFEDCSDFPFDQGLLWRGYIKFVFDFAHDLLQNVFNRNHTCS